MKKKLLAIALLVSAVTVQAKEADDREGRAKIVEVVRQVREIIKRLPETPEKKDASDKLKEVKVLAQEPDIKDSAVKQQVTKAAMKLRAVARFYKEGSEKKRDLDKRISELEEAKKGL